MELYERIRELRKNHLHMSQTDFGKKLGVSRSVINNIELNALAKPEQKLSLMKLICKEFSVNEEWLMNGIEPMFVEPDIFNLDNFVKSHDATELELEIIKIYFELDPDIRKELVKHFKNKLAKSIPAAEPPEPANEIHDIQQEYSGTPSSIASAEAAYEKRLNIAQHTESTALNTTKNTGNKQIR